MNLHKVLKISFIFGLLVSLPLYVCVCVIFAFLALIIGNFCEADAGAQPVSVPGGRRDGGGQHGAQGPGWCADCGASLRSCHHSLSLLQQ